jgi:hypothetical protein
MRKHVLRVSAKEAGETGTVSPAILLAGFRPIILQRRFIAQKQFHAHRKLT